MPGLKGLREIVAGAVLAGAGRRAGAGAGAGAAAGGNVPMVGAVVAGAVKAKAVAAAVLFCCAFALAVPVTLAWSNYTQAALNEALGTAAPGEGTLVVEKKVESGGLEIPAELSDGLFSFKVQFYEAEGWQEGDPSVADAEWRIVDASGADVPAGGASGAVAGEGGSGAVGAGHSVEFRLRDGQRCVFKKVPEGAKWEVSEVGVDGSVFEVVERNPSGAMDADGEKALFTNKYKRGDIDVGKEAVRQSGEPLTGDDYSTPYEFEYEFSDGKDYEPVVVDEDTFAALARERAAAARAAGGAPSEAPAVDVRELEVYGGEGGEPVTVQSVEAALAPADALSVSDKPAEGLAGADSGSDSGQGDVSGLSEADGSAGEADGSGAGAGVGARSEGSGEGEGADAGAGAGSDEGADAGAGSEGSGSGGAASDAGGSAGSEGAGEGAGSGSSEGSGSEGSEGGDAGGAGGERLRTFTLMPGQHVVFKGVPDGVKCTVREIVPDGAGWHAVSKEMSAVAHARKSESVGFKNVIDDVDGPVQGGVAVGKQVVCEDGAEPTEAQAAEEFKVRLSIDAAALARAGFVVGVPVPGEGEDPEVAPGAVAHVPALRLAPGEEVPSTEALDAAWAARLDPANRFDSATGRLFAAATGDELDVPHLPKETLTMTVGADGRAACEVTLSHGEHVVVWGLSAGAPFSAAEEMTEAQAQVYTCATPSVEGVASRGPDLVVFANEATEPTVDVPVEKRWVLARDLAAADPWYDGVENAALPEGVTVRLLGKDGEVADSCLLNEAGSWRHVFEGLPAFDESGARIGYAVEEEPVEGFDGEIAGSAAEGFVVTNTQHVEIEPVVAELPQIEKAVSGEGAEEERDPFAFEVRALDGAPLPEGAASDGGESFEVRLPWAGTASVGTVSFERDGTYRYEYREVPLGFPGWLYDTSVHSVEVVVAREGDALVAHVSIDGVPAEGAGEGSAGAGAVVFENTYDPDAVTEGDLVVTMEVAETDGFPLTEAHMEQEFLAEVELVLPEGASARDASREVALWTHERYEGAADDTEEETRTLRYKVLLNHADANRPHFFGEDGPAPEPAVLSGASSRELTAVDAALEASLARGSFGTTGEAAESGPVAVYDARCLGDAGAASFELGEDGRPHAKVSMMLKHGERLHVSKLPLGTEFTATHAMDGSYPKDSWSPNITLAEGTVPEPDTRHVRLINSPKDAEAAPPEADPPDTSPEGPDSGASRVVKSAGALGQTGDLVRWLILGAAAVCAAAAVALVVSIRRTRRRGR